MGDHCAVDFALEGHEHVLLEAGLLSDESWARGDRPTPGGSLLMQVVIDDLITAAKAPRSSPLSLPLPGRADVVALQIAADAYGPASMPGAPDKDQAKKSCMTAAGLEIEGFAGLGGPSP